MRFKGFTLAELLIALAILGVIATFTIPKVLTANQNGQHKAIGKEAAAMFSGAYQAYQLENTPSATTTLADLTPFMNYVKMDTSGALIDNIPGSTSTACSGSYVCLRLHNGAVILYKPSLQFSGTASNNALWFDVDPNGIYSGSAIGSGKAVDFRLYFSGRLTTEGTMLTNTCDSDGCGNPDPNNDPSWFSWN